MRKQIKLICFILLLWALPAHVFSQTRIVSGRVINSTGEAVPLATVQLKGTKTFVTADGAGHFSINVSGEAPVLLVSSTGYQQIEIPVTAATSYDITMKEAGTLNEVV